MIRLALRFDDPSAVSNRSLEEQILAAADHARVPLTIAVIPYSRRGRELTPLDKVQAGHLIDAQRDGRIEIAQHGYSHEAEASHADAPTEFRGVAPALQLERITAGREVLRAVFDAPIAGFVPPWNTFDAATTHALERLGYRYLSAWHDDDGYSERLAYLPRTCQLAALNTTLDTLTAFVQLQPIVIAVMHDYDFEESGRPEARLDLPRFAALLRSIADDPAVQTVTLAKLADEQTAQRESRARQSRWQRLPPPLRNRLPRGALLRHSWRRLLVHYALR